jgi:hypothetical protein
MAATSITPHFEPAIQIGLDVSGSMFGRKSGSRYSQGLMPFIYIGA